MTDLVAIATEKDEQKLAEFFADLNNLQRTADDGSTVFHLAALENNADFFNAAVAAMKTAGVDNLDVLSQYLTTEVDGLTPVHVAVAAKAIEVLRTLSYWQRQYDNVGFTAALGTPADQTKRPAALAEALYGKHDEIYSYTFSKTLLALSTPFTSSRISASLLLGAPVRRFSRALRPQEACACCRSTAAARAASWRLVHSRACKRYCPRASTSATCST